MMLRFWLPFMAIYGEAISEIKYDSKEKCHGLKHLENDESSSYLKCEKFCITYDCKRCRMVCLSREYQDRPNVTKKRDCRIQEFLTTNCGMENKTTIKDNNKGNIQISNINKTCGFLTVSQITNENEDNKIVDLEECGKKLVNSPWFFEMKGNGSGQLLFYMGTFSESTNTFEETSTIDVDIPLGIVHSGGRIAISMKHLKASARRGIPVRDTYKFWIEIRKLEDGMFSSHSHEFQMGQGDVIGEEIFTDLFLTINKLAETFKLTAHTYEGKLDWKFAVNDTEYTERELMFRLGSRRTSTFCSFIDFILRVFYFFYFILYTFFGRKIL